MRHGSKADSVRRGLRVDGKGEHNGKGQASCNTLAVPPCCAHNSAAGSIPTTIRCPTSLPYFITLPGLVGNSWKCPPFHACCTGAMQETCLYLPFLARTHGTHGTKVTLQWTTAYQVATSAMTIQTKGLGRK